MNADKADDISCQKCSALVEENARLKATLRRYSLALDNVLTGKSVNQNELGET